MAEEQKQEFWRWTESNWKNPDVDWNDAQYMTVGIDVGSVSSQAVIMADGQIHAYGNMRTGFDSLNSAGNAMAFALKSKFILLDEPTSGVATGDKFKVMDTIVSAIRREKMACMIIEHDMDIVSDYSDRVLVLSEGEIIADGKPEQVMEQDNVKEILFGVRA